MSLLRRFRALTFIIVLTLVATACGGGGDDSADDPTTTTTAASGGGGDDGKSDGDGASDATTTTTAAPATGDSGSDWCDGLRELEDGQSPVNFDFFNLTAQGLEEEFQTALDLFDRWTDSAPDEIADDMAVFRDAFRGWFERARELGFDLNAMSNDDEFFSSFDDPAIEAAANSIDAYGRDVCGVDFNITADNGSGTDGEPPSGGTDSDDPVEIVFNALQIPASLFSEDDIDCIREALGPEFEAGITPDWVPTAGDIELLFSAVDTCGIELG